MRLLHLWKWGRLESDEAAKPDPSACVSIDPRREGDPLAEMARIYEGVGGVGVNWPYMSDFQRRLRIQAIRMALGWLGRIETIEGCDQETMGHFRAALAALLGSSGRHGHELH